MEVSAAIRALRGISLTGASHRQFATEQRRLGDDTSLW